MDGSCRVYDVSDPHKPQLAHTQQKIGAQVNMVSQTWDGERVYFTSSLLAKWDKKGADNEQFLKAYGWDGKKLDAAVRGRLHERRSSAGRTSCASGRTSSTRTRSTPPRRHGRLAPRE